MIDSLPPSLNWDEVSHGYNAYSILKTGKDEWGKFMPIIFRAYGDYKLPVYIYTVVVSEFFLGLSALAVRLPSILAGVGSVLMTYLLVMKLFDKKKVALIASFLVAVEPWGLFISRIAAEANLASFLIISGIYFFVSKKYSLSALLLGLSVWTYNSARIFVPVMIVALVSIYWKEVKEFSKGVSKKFLFSTLILSAFLLPMFYQLANPVGQARYSEVKIIDQGTIARIEEARNNSALPSILPRAIHNKVTYFAKSIFENYFTHFSPKFLFFEGGSDYQFNVQGIGLIYLINAPFMLIGLYVLFKNFKQKNNQLISAWLVFAPLASSLTREAPHVLRTIVILPTPMILSALGVNEILKISKNIKTKNLMLAAYFFVLGVSIEKYATKAFFEYRNQYSWSWQYGYKEMVNYIKENYDRYEKIIITKKYGEPHEFILFYWPWNPESYRDDQNLNRFFQSNWYWVDSFNKFYFINDWQVKELVLESGENIDCNNSCLLITSPDNAPQDFNKIDEINFLNGDRAFEIYEKN